MNVWILHGIIAFVAWGVLSPVASVSSTFRREIFSDPLWDRSDRSSTVGRGWVTVHRHVHEGTILLTWILFFLAVGNVRPGHHFNNSHKLVGFVIFLFTLPMWGMGRILYPPKRRREGNTSPTDAPSADEDTEPGEITALIASTPSAKDDDVLSRMECQGPSPEDDRTTLRTTTLVWIHRVLGFIISIAALWEIHSGLVLLYGVNSIYHIVYFTWCGIVGFAIVILSVRQFVKPLRQTKREMK